MPSNDVRVSSSRTAEPVNSADCIQARFDFGGIDRRTDQPLAKKACAHACAGPVDDAEQGVL